MRRNIYREIVVSCVAAGLLAFGLTTAATAQQADPGTYDDFTAALEDADGQVQSLQNVNAEEAEVLIVDLDDLAREEPGQDVEQVLEQHSDKVSKLQGDAGLRIFLDQRNIDLETEEIVAVRVKDGDQVVLYTSEKKADKEERREADQREAGEIEAEDRGPEDRGPQDTGPEDRGPQDTGPEERGPEDTETDY